MREGLGNDDVSQIIRRTHVNMLRRIIVFTDLYHSTRDKDTLRFKASNGEIIAVFQTYADKTSCLEYVTTMGSHTPDADIVLKNSDQSAIHNRWPSNMNGPVDFGFMRAFRRRYL